mmetsp:Transcript_60009/g.69499  ORF Transcript_60009/g.69499 Transcript_60009/m.69499 type:complete len:692 (+) Transcript_60009:34-2109(+)
MPSRRFLIASLLSLGVLCSLFVFLDNTDLEVRNYSNEDIEIQMFAGSDPELLKALMEAKENPVEEIEFNEEDHLKCLYDKTATGSAREQLQSFVEGECAPIIIVPGLSGTRLMVQIDCEELQAHHPDIMDACGWGTCSSWNIFKRKPSKEYVLWVPKLFSPLGAFTISDHKCFGKMMSFDYQKSQKLPYNKYAHIKGLEVTWYGNTPETYNDADGGFNSVQDLAPLPVQTKGTKEFRGLADNLVKMGYQKGLSLFTIPYDFRLNHMANSVRYSLERTIRYAYELTGKKAVIIGHSLGNINTLPVLTKITPEMKDKMVAAFIALMPPFGGVSGTIRTHVGGDDSLLLTSFLGVQVSNQRQLMTAFSSIFELLPGDAFFRFKDEPWMKEIIARVEAEEKYDIKTPEGAEYWSNTSDIPLPWFPNPSNTCFENFKLRPEECRTLISDMTKIPIAVIEGEEFYAKREDIYKLIDERFHFLSSTEFTRNMYNDALQNKNFLMTNPGVPVVYVYGSHIPTEITNEWYEDPDLTIMHNAFKFPDKQTKKYGDDRVEVSYSLPIALKWAWEHKNQTAHAKPVKIVEYCSNYNMGAPIWDANDKSGSKMTKTEYMGLPCDCWEENKNGIDGKNCDHTSILNDVYFYNLVKEVAQTKETVHKNTAAYKLTPSEILELTHSLPHIRKPREEQSVRKWLYGSA